MDLKSLYLVNTVEGIIPAGLLEQDDFAIDEMLNPKKRRVVQVRKIVGGKFVERFYEDYPSGRPNPHAKHRPLMGWGPKTLTVKVKK